MFSDFLDSFEKQINYFSKKVVDRFAPASEQMILNAEEKIGCKLSPQYKEFLRRHNGIQIVEVTLHGVPLLDPQRRLTSTNIVKEFLALRDSSFDWPHNWLRMGQDGFGSFYVADLLQMKENEEYPILFVDHEVLLGDERSGIFFAGGYFDLLAKVTAKMLSLYRPDGRLKSQAGDT